MRAPWLAERVISLRSSKRCRASRRGPRLTPYCRASSGLADLGAGRQFARQDGHAQAVIDLLRQSAAIQVRRRRSLRLKVLTLFVSCWSLQAAFGFVKPITVDSFFPACLDTENTGT